MQTVYTLDRNQQLVISERERRREWIKPGVYSLRLKPKTSFEPGLNLINNVVCLNYIMYLHVLFLFFFLKKTCFKLTQHRN